MKQAYMMFSPQLISDQIFSCRRTVSKYLLSWNNIHDGCSLLIRSNLEIRQWIWVEILRYFSALQSFYTEHYHFIWYHAKSVKLSEYFIWCCIFSPRICLTLKYGTFCKNNLHISFPKSIRMRKRWEGWLIRWLFITWNNPDRILKCFLPWWSK